MKTETKKEKAIQLVCRHTETFREFSRQRFDATEKDRADRIMIARNRAHISANDHLRWGIETETHE